MNIITDFKLFESRLTIPRKRLGGIYYHGSCMSDDSGLFNEFYVGYADWDAIWVSDDEHISEEFSEWHANDEDVRVVYRVKVKSTGIADIDYETTQRMEEDWGLSDFRESIEILKRKGFKGWSVPGSIGMDRYDDIALFYPKEQTKILDCKLYISEDWTEYMSLDKAQEIIDEHFQN